MKTIKERATESAYKHYVCESCEWIYECRMSKGFSTPFDCCDCAADDYIIGYVKGATEQREIDIQKACEWLKEQFPNTYEEANLIEEFTKAMSK